LPRASGDAMHRSIAACLDKLKLNSLGSHNDAQNSGKGKTVDLSERDTRTEDVTSQGIPIDEDTGWDSDQSTPDPGSSSSNQLTPTNSVISHTKSPKRKTSLHIVVRNRRRSLIHRNSASHSHTASGAGSVFDNDRGELTRGREPITEIKRYSRPSTAPSSRLSSRLNSPSITRPSSLRNLRLDQIKAHGSNTSRDASPSRSIRFADDDNIINANPPRIASSQDHSPITPDDAVGNERNQVTFDLPTPKR